MFGLNTFACIQVGEKYFFKNEPCFTTLPIGERISEIQSVDFVWNHWWQPRTLVGMEHFVSLGVFPVDGNDFPSFHDGSQQTQKQRRPTLKCSSNTGSLLVISFQELMCFVCFHVSIRNFQKFICSSNFNLLSIALFFNTQNRPIGVGV